MNFISRILIIISLFCGVKSSSEIVNKCFDNNDVKFTEAQLLTLVRSIVPVLEGMRKGQAGKIGVIGGSIEYTGAPYFSAITSLKAGADLVFVITTESAAPPIKSYSPDLIVYPYIGSKNEHKIGSVLAKTDIVVIGPGLGRDDEDMNFFYSIIEICKNLNKPLVIDADGLYAIYKNISIIKDYPAPGVILTPNVREKERLIEAVNNSNSSIKWYKYWGENVAVLVKGKEDEFYSDNVDYEWTLSKGGSVRRAGGQGDILSGSLGTFYNWALKTNLCNNTSPSILLAQSVASYGAAKFTRTCNSKAFSFLGRSMMASDMITQIHDSFEDLFG